MALKKKIKKSKPKKLSIPLTLWDVCLSYPDLHEPKPFRGNVYFKTDILMDPDNAQLKELREAIQKIRVATWGEDKDEWPEGAAKRFIQNGDEREDQKGYKGKKYLTATKNAEFGTVSVMDMKGKPFNPQSVRGGMFADVAITLSAWKPDESGESQGMSIFLDGIRINTAKKSLNFGGGKSLEDRFGMGKSDGDEDDDPDADVSSDEDDEADTPRKSKKSAATQKKTGKKKTARDFDDEEE